MILHRSTRRVATVAVAALMILLARVVAADPLDSILDDLIEDQIESQVESALVDAIEQAVATEVEDALESELVDGLEELGRAATDALGRIDEVAPAPSEAFVASFDEEGQTVERGVWVLLVEPHQLEQVIRQGFTVREQRRLEAVDRVLLRVEAPRDRELMDAARQLALEAPGVEADHNHLYRNDTGRKAVEGGAVTPASSPGPEPSMAIAIIDTALAQDHDALREADIVQRDFVSYSGPRPLAHGTAVASILVGHGGARLYAASVFFIDGQGRSAATTVGLVQALDWAVASGALVVNMSLSGPPNRVLEAAIERVAERGIVVVAAVGNGGPAGGPLYPAAYAPVVGVTALDAGNRVYRYANRGAQVTFAAPGVDIVVALEDGAYGKETGTSMAAPHAAAIIARALADSPQSPARVLQALKATALDLGDAGFDETFGFGRITAIDQP